MSVKVNNWVWQHSPREIDGNPFNGNPFTVLQALADIANDDGQVIYADRDSRTQEALAYKARVSLRTFQRAIVLLSDAGILTVTLTGRENIYRINMGAGHSKARQSDVLVTPGETGVSLSTHVSSGVSGTPAVADHKDVLTEDLNQSSQKLSTDAGALRADDEVSTPRLGFMGRRRLGTAKHHLNVLDLNDAVGDLFAQVAGGENQRRIVYLVALRILGKAAKAKTSLHDPTRYVIAAIEAEPHVWVKAAFQMDYR